MEPYVDLIILCVSGFTVELHHDSGVQSLHVAFRKRYQADWPLAEISYRTWDADWESVAKRLNKVAVEGCPTIFVAHSWGCGWGYKQFEKYWTDAGRRIDRAVLIDPVPRPFQFIRLGNIWALSRFGVFKTYGARHVWTVRQVNNRPIGRRVLAGNSLGFEQRVYGSKDALTAHGVYRHALSKEIVQDATVCHNTIDDDIRVKGDVLDLVGSYVRTLENSRK